MIMTFSKNLISAFLALTFFISTSIESKELDVPGPDLDFIKYELYKSMRDGDERESMKQYAELGLHCTSLFMHERILQEFGRGEEYLAKLDQLMIEATRMAADTLNKDYFKEELSSRNDDIRNWYWDHREGGPPSEAWFLLGKEINQCQKIMLGLKENLSYEIEEFLKNNP